MEIIREYLARKTISWCFDLRHHMCVNTAFVVLSRFDWRLSFKAGREQFTVAAGQDQKNCHLISMRIGRRRLTSIFSIFFWQSFIYIFSPAAHWQAGGFFYLVLIFEAHKWISNRAASLPIYSSMTSHNIILEWPRDCPFPCCFCLFILLPGMVVSAWIFSRLYLLKNFNDIGNSYKTRKES